MTAYPPELGHGDDTPPGDGGDGALAPPKGRARAAQLSAEPDPPRPSPGPATPNEPAEPQGFHPNGHTNGQWIAPAGRSRLKRALDVGLTLAALPVLGVVCLVIALLVAVTSRGPVLFFQDRIGLGGRRFRMVKFRTMQVDAESKLRADPKMWNEYVRNDYKLPAEADSRVTVVGRFLRRSSLDELPQLLNVLGGQMSLVGPRPIVPDEIEMYGADKAAYLSVRPGITGTWQVNGRSGIGYPDRTALDREYVETWKLRKDVGILLRTPLAVLSSRGAH